jgi:hypothetical protein
LVNQKWEKKKERKKKRYFFLKRRRCDLVYNSICELINLMAVNDCLEWFTGEGLDRALTLEFTHKNSLFFNVYSRNDIKVWKVSPLYFKYFFLCFFSSTNQLDRSYTPFFFGSII